MKESLKLLGIPDMLISVISVCLATTKMNINWQGRSSREFSSSFGLRQEDPLSSYLFVIALERLSHYVLDAIDNDVWKPMRIGRGGPALSHIMFAYDIILIAEASCSQAQSNREIIDSFCTCSGQRINLSKSKVFFL